MADDLQVVNFERDILPHKAWADFRAKHLGASFVPKNYTVPSHYPPETRAGVEAYLHLVKASRKAANVPEANPPPMRESRPLLWWMQCRKVWKAHWRESEVPDGEVPCKRYDPLTREDLAGKRAPKHAGSIGSSDHSGRSRSRPALAIVPSSPERVKELLEAAERRTQARKTEDA